MKVLSLSLSLTALTLLAPSLFAQTEAPQFRSLTPKASPSSERQWVQDLNAMSPEERRRRVRTFARPQPSTSPSPAAAPPRATGRPAAAPVSSGDPLSASSHREPPPSALPTSLYQRSRDTAGRAPQPPLAASAASAPASTVAVAPVSAPRPQPSAALRQPSTSLRIARSETPPQPRASSLAQTKPTKTASAPSAASRFFAAATKPFRRSSKTGMSSTATQESAAPSMPPPQTVPVSTARQEKKAAALRQKMAWMPTRSSSLKSDPWAPYASKAEYLKARQRTQWQPRGALAERQEKARREAAQKKSPRRWSLASLFGSKSKNTGKDDQASPRRGRSTPLNPGGKMPQSRLVTSGLPQSERSSGALIETTLFGG